MGVSKRQVVEKAGKLIARFPPPIMSSDWGSDLMGLDTEEESAPTDLLQVRYLQDSTILSKRSTEGSAGYDTNAACSCIIPTKHKRIVQIGLALSLPKGVYARIALRSGLAGKKYIDIGVGVIDRDYRGEVEVVLFNHSAVDFQVQVGDRIAQLISEKIKIPHIQQVKILSSIDKGAGGFGSTGM